MTIHAMTIDVEDYFQVQAFADHVDRAGWDRIPCRVEANTDTLLDQFARAGVSATFFTLGWVAERHPAMIRRIVAAGHELASHGYEHVLADTQDPETFRQDVRRTKRILEDIGGVEVAGYRAATFSIGPHNAWAFAILAEEGHRYSSSTYPVTHDRYGDPNGARAPYQPEGGGGIWEFPMTTWRVAGRNLPCSGGGWFRQLPYPLYRLLFAQAARASGQPGIFYLHPWEIDAGQPRMDGIGLGTRLRHYRNLGACGARLDAALRDFRWGRMDQVFAHQLDGPAARHAA